MTTYSQIQLKTADIQLDLYNQARQRGLLHPQMTLQLREFLVKGFAVLMSQLQDLYAPITDTTLFCSGTRPCFNYMTQWLRLPFLKCLAFCLPEGDARDELNVPNLHKMDNPAYLPLYKKIAGYLFLLRAREQLLWFFFQVPNYNNYNKAGYRFVYQEMIDHLQANWPKTLYFHSTEPRTFEILTLGTTYYYNLAYHGQSNREILAKFAQFLRTINPELGMIAPHIRMVGGEGKTPRCILKVGSSLLDAMKKEYIDRVVAPDPISHRIKILFVSHKLTAYTSVFRDRIGIINQLNRRFFDVYLAVFGDETVIKTQLSQDPIVKYYLDPYLKNDRMLYLTKTNTVTNQQTVAGYKFDILFYPDLGMTQAQTLLAHARLAPIQITTWGHSDTSGNPAIDYYITSKWFEQTEDLNIPKQNYSEKAILLSSLGTYYYSPRAIIREHCGREYKNADPELSFQPIDIPGGGEGIVIGCLQSFYKFSEEFEDTLASILKLTEPMSQGGYKVYLALSNSIPFCKEHLARLNKKLGPYINRVLWFQNKKPVEWLNIVSKCRVMLDPYPFGGCNTTLEAFDYGVPVVCLPSPTMINGRFTSGFYKKMGLSQYISTTREGYIQQVMRFIQDDTYYLRAKTEILKKKACLFEDTDSLLEYHQVLYNLIVRHTATV